MSHIQLQDLIALHQNILLIIIKEGILARPLLYLFVDRAGWDFPKYLQILKEYDIYKTEEDYLNIKFEEPPEIGEFSDRLIKQLVAIPNINIYYVPQDPVISAIRQRTERKQIRIWKGS